VFTKLCPLWGRGYYVCVCTVGATGFMYVVLGENGVFLMFYGTQRLITLLTRAHHQSLSLARLIKFMPLFQFNIILPSTYRSSEWSLVVLSSLLLFRASCVRISSAPSSQTPSVYVPTLKPKTKFHINTEPQANYSFV
jgi:hypothetical protein